VLESFTKTDQRRLNENNLINTQLSDSDKNRQANLFWETDNQYYLLYIVYDSIENK
jgi:hypothetical protein